MPLIDYEELVVSVTKSEMRNILLVDCHLDDALDCQNSTTRWSFRSVAHLFTSSGASANFKHLVYSFDNWQVIMAWPKGWSPPAPNRLGWLPKGEFCAANRYFNGLNPDLEFPIAPFTYRDYKGEMFTPSGPVTGP